MSFDFLPQHGDRFLDNAGVLIEVTKVHLEFDGDGSVRPRGSVGWRAVDQTGWIGSTALWMAQRDWTSRQPDRPGIRFTRNMSAPGGINVSLTVGLPAHPTEDEKMEARRVIRLAYSEVNTEINKLNDRPEPTAVGMVVTVSGEGRRGAFTAEYALTRLYSGLVWKLLDRTVSAPVTIEHGKLPSIWRLK